jgi:aminopeptidase N
MEHTSATTLTLRTLHDERAHLDMQSDGLVAHELAHQWWGDLLTCKDWAEIWLNESFATYFTTLWFEKDRGWDEATWERHREAVEYKGEDKDRYRRPIVTYRYPSSDSMFDSHSYPKGGRVLHMLRFVLGDDGFWRTMRQYAHANEYDVVETADLRDAVYYATGQGLGWFFDQWVHHGGHPQYKVRYVYDNRDRVIRMTVEQTQEVDSVTPLFRMPVEIEIVTPSETISRRITVAYVRSSRAALARAVRSPRLDFEGPRFREVEGGAARSARARQEYYVPRVGDRRPFAAQTGRRG